MSWSAHTWPSTMPRTSPCGLNLQSPADRRQRDADLRQCHRLGVRSSSTWCRRPPKACATGARTSGMISSGRCGRGQGDAERRARGPIDCIPRALSLLARATIAQGASEICCSEAVAADPGYALAHAALSPARGPSWAIDDKARESARTRLRAGQGPSRLRPSCRSKGASTRLSGEWSKAADTYEVLRGFYTRRSVDFGAAPG